MSRVNILRIVAVLFLIVAAAFCFPPPAKAALAPSMQFPTAISLPSGPYDAVGSSRTITYGGTTGVVLTETTTNITVHQPGGFCGLGGNAPGSTANADPNVIGFTEPDFPATSMIPSEECRQAERTGTFSFNKPILGPILHIVNLDSSWTELGGTSTTGGIYGHTTIVKNIPMDIAGNRFNAGVLPFANNGCSDDAGNNPNHACGSFRITPSSGFFKDFTLHNNDAGNAGDSWLWAVSFQAANLTKTYSSPTITAGQPTQLTFTLTNPAEPEAIPLAPLDFTDTLPAGVALTSSVVTDNGQCGVPTLSDGSGGSLDAGDGSFRAGDISLAVGATCTFTITVTATTPGTYVNNNSNISSDIGNVAPNVDATLTVDPPTWTVKKSASSTTAQPGDTISYTVTIENTSPAPLTGVNAPTFVDDLTAVLDDATFNNDASPSTGINYTAPNLTWSGDLAAGEIVNFTYSITVNAADNLGDGQLLNVITDTGSSDGPTNCPDPPITNPSDPSFNPDCVSITQIEAYTATKTSSATGPVRAGDVVTYTLTIENTGSTTLTGITASDNLSGVLDDATYNNDASTTLGAASYSAPTLTWTGNLAVGQIATITYSITIQSASVTGDANLTNAVVGGQCADPAITDPSDPNFNPDCVTSTAVREWVATKTATPASGTTAPGQIITYTITVTNTGTMNLTGADAPSLSDNLSAVIDDATYNNNASATIGTPIYTAPNLTWTNDLAPGQTATIAYSVTINAADALADGLLGNAITGTGGSADATNCLAPAITNPSDPNFKPECVIIHNVAAYTAIKTSSASGPVAAGDVVSYTLTINNTGSTTLTGISTSDDLSAVLDDATYNNNASASIGTVSFTAPNITWAGDLAAGQIATVTYSVTINPASVAGDGRLLNAVLGSNNCPNPAITDPAAPGFNPDCVTSTAVSEWVGTKTSNPEGAIKPGDTITYTITVSNTGGINLSGADAPAIQDDLSAVLDDATYNNDASATIGTPTFVNPTISWTNDLNVGQTATITYSVTVNGANSLGDGIFTNAVTGPPNCIIIFAPGDTDCSNIRYIENFEVEKTSDPADGSTVQPGQIITYAVTIHNTGATNLTDFSFEDNLSDVLDDASLTSNPTVVGGSGTATVNGAILHFQSNIPAGQTVTVSYAVTVHADAAANANLHNLVTGPFSSCILGTEPDCITTHTVIRPMGTLADTGMNEIFFIGLAVMLLGFAISLKKVVFTA